MFATLLIALSVFVGVCASFEDMNVWSSGIGWFCHQYLEIDWQDLVIDLIIANILCIYFSELNLFLHTILWYGWLFWDDQLEFSIDIDDQAAAIVAVIVAM